MSKYPGDIEVAGQHFHCGVDGKLFFNNRGFNLTQAKEALEWLKTLVTVFKWVPEIGDYYHLGNPKFEYMKTSKCEGGVPLCVQIKPINNRGNSDKMSGSPYYQTNAEMLQLKIGCVLLEYDNAVLRIDGLAADIQLIQVNRVCRWLEKAIASERWVPEVGQRFRIKTEDGKVFFGIDGGASMTNKDLPRCPWGHEAELEICWVDGIVGVEVDVAWVRCNLGVKDEVDFCVSGPWRESIEEAESSWCTLVNPHQSTTAPTVDLSDFAGKLYRNSDLTNAGTRVVGAVADLLEEFHRQTTKEDK